MTRTRKPRTLRRTLIVAVLRSLLIVGAFGASVLVSDAMADAPQGFTTEAPAVAPAPYSDRLDTLTARHACGDLPAGTIPAHAIVLRGDTVRVVTFDQGWAVYQGEAPGTLLAVCAR